MNELFSTWLFDLGRITLVLSVAALAVGFALRFIRPTTIRLHRTAWCLVLLIGWLFVRLPVSIPWYEPEVVPVQKEIVASEFPETGFLESKDLALEPLPDNLPKDLPVNLFADAATLDKMAVPLEEIKASKPVLEPQKPETPSSAVKPIPVDVPASAGDGTNPFHWGLALLVVWILGMIVTLLRWLLGYVRSLRSMSTALQPDDVSARQWQTLLAEQGIDREIPLRLTENMGPLLCRWPDGYELVVPAKLWESLSPSVRLSVMRHELAHYQRGDVWKSLAIRILALPHWFNPAAWWAVRRFEEAAEWACDEAAIGNDVRSTDYARTLLAIAEASLGGGSCHPSMSRLNLSARIRRLVTSQTRKDSIMKKTTLTTLAILLLAFCLVRIELVAKTPATETTTQEAATQKTAESSDQNASTETQAPPEDEAAPLRYNGKTFDEWKKNLDAETNPEQLCNAIEAFVALGIQENRSEEAAKLIARLMQTHSYSLSTNDWPDDQTVLMKAIHVFMGQKLDEGSYVKVDNAIPYEIGIPVLCQELEQGNDKSRSFVLTVFAHLLGDDRPYVPVALSDQTVVDSVRKQVIPALTKFVKIEASERMKSYARQILGYQQDGKTAATPSKLEFRILANHQDHDELIRLAEKSDEAQVLDDQGKRLAWWVPVKVKEVEKFKASIQDRIITRTVKHDGVPRLEVLVVNDSHNVTDAFLRRADTNIDAYGDCSIRLSLSKTGGERLGKLTSENLPDEKTGTQRFLGIIINSELFAAPLVFSTIKDAAFICGNFTQQEAESIVDLLTPVKKTTPATENKSPNATINANGGTFTADRISLTLTDKNPEETNPQLGVSITSSNSYDKDGVTALVKITVENRDKTPLEDVEIKFSSGQAFKWDSVTATYQLEDGNLVWKRDSLPPHTSIEYLVRGKITSLDNPPLCWAHVSSAQGVNAETLYVPNIHGAVWAADLVPIDEKPAVQEQEPKPAMSVATKPKSPTDENYRIEPPDVLRIELDKVVPKKPYRLAAYDVIQIKAINTLLNHPIDGYFLIESEGYVNLGPAYGTVKVVDMTTEEAEKAILKQLETILKGPGVTVELMRAAGMLPITGTYLVGPDGTINLKKYGQIHVADLTMAHAKLVVQKHLEKWLESPKVSMDVGKYQSKHYYLVIAREGLRSNIVRVPFVGNETILDAIALIHDFDASKVKIQIARPNSNGGQLLNVDCFKLNTLTNSYAGGYHLQPNDRVLVLQRKTAESQNELPMPHEGFMTNLPTYRIEPPDLIQIEGIKLVPIKQEITPGDVLEINAINLLIKAPIHGYYDVDSEGQVSLGPAYGKVKVSGMTAKEARETIQKHLETTIIDPEVSLRIAKSSSVKPITGTYLVGPDGTVNLRTYGSVQVSGKTIAEARKVIEKHLSKSLLNPVVSVDIAAYNSKVFYIIQKSDSGGDNVTTIPITGRETVLDALSRLQGLVDFFKVTSIRLVRISQDKSETSLPIDYQAIITGRDTKTNYQIFPGDRLYIESPKPEK